MLERIVICGGPKSGKTTLSRKYKTMRVIHCDDYAGMGWSEASDELAAIMIKTAGPWVMEGVAAVRALRKALEQVELPCDRVVWMGAINARQSKSQAAMGKGCKTVMDQLRPILAARGIKVDNR